MNRCTRLAVAVLAFTFAAAPASGQGLSAFVGAGPSIAIGDFGDVADAGWMVGAGVLVPVGQAGMWVGGEGMYGRNGAKNFDESFTITGAGGMLGMTFSPAAQMSPFVFGSVGFVSLGATATGAESNSGVSFGAGGGVSFALTPTINAFGAGRFINARIEGENVQFIPITVGVTFGLGGQ